MENTPLYGTQYMPFFEEALTCGHRIYSWRYSSDGHLSRTNCPNLVLDTVLEHTGCKQYILDYGENHTEPLVVGAQLGLLWCAVFERRDGRLHALHVIGPVFSTEISLRTIEDAMRKFDVSLNYKGNFIKILQGLPVVSTVLLFQYALMLHYCVTGEKLERSDIQYQESELSRKGQKREARQKDRHQTWSVEQALLRMVREGDMNYQAAFTRAGELSSGVQVSTGQPIEQAIISCVVFTSLCVRAAIEGGLSPESAYALGDSYIQSMTQCQTVTELATMNHEMYIDFIRRVRKCRTNMAATPQVQSCIDYIELHLEEELTLEMLAKRVGYAPYYLSRKFKQDMGVNIADYIRFTRIERAKMLLTTTDMPVRDIAERLQFCSASYFAEKFQEVAGATPQQWRRQTKRL